MSSEEPTAEVSLGNTFLRVVWMFGPMAIALVAFTIGSEPAWQFSIRDALFWLLVAFVIGGRVLDGTRFGGLTAAGEPTSRADLAKYGITVMVISSLMWLTAIVM
jgi:hypothetical protein